MPALPEGAGQRRGLVIRPADDYDSWSHSYVVDTSRRNSRLSLATRNHRSVICQHAWRLGLVYIIIATKYRWSES